MAFPKVLLVDDDTMVTRALVRVLAQRCRLNVTVASTALQALDYMNKEEFVVLVADFSLPGISAPSLFKIAAERWPSMQRVLFTGHTRESLSKKDLALTDLLLEKGMEPGFIAQKICAMAGAPRI